MINRFFKYYFSSGLILLLLLASCSPRYYNTSHLDKMRWLEGKWSAEEQGIRISEHWKYYKGERFQGVSFITAGKDTLFRETTEIVPGPKRSIVFSSFSGQIMLEESTPMKLVALQKHAFTFQTEDKLKTVTYTHKKGNVMQIEIIEKSGENSGKTKYQLNKIQE